MRKIGTFLAALAVTGVAWGLAAVPASASTHIRHYCPSLVVFSLPHGSGTLTETQGPWLRVNEVAAYRGRTYTITSVTHTGFLGHDRFTVSGEDGIPVVNSGPSIRHGEAHLSC